MRIKNPEYYLKVFLLVFSAILLFTFIDYLVHGLSQSFSVPDYYFRNKIIFGTIYGFIIYLFTEKMKTLPRALAFSGIIAVLLQINYYFQGYAKWFVFLFLGLHFLMLLVSSLVMFRISKKYKWVK